MLTSLHIETPLGGMIAIADEHKLYLLQFADHKAIDRQIKQLQQELDFHVTSGITEPLVSIKQELSLYFEGKLREFKTKHFCVGTQFQKITWQELCNVSYGQTRSYTELATMIDKPQACRAVANANGANKMAILFPCHRIIVSNGGLGGYSGGIERKKWLLAHEQRMICGD